MITRRGNRVGTVAVLAALAAFVAPLFAAPVAAQAGPVDALAGNAGWASFGLSGLLLSWLLLKHLPAKDEQLATFIAAKDAQAAALAMAHAMVLKEQRDQFLAAMTAQREDFHQTLEVTAKTCEREVTIVIQSARASSEAIQKELELLGASITALANLLHMCFRDSSGNPVPVLMRLPPVAS